MAFSFEDLKVYQAALTWNDRIYKVLEDLGTKCSRSLKDQMERASISIPLNIAEGNGRWHKGEKRQFFWIARGSSFECVALVQILAKRGLISESVRAEMYSDLEGVSKMLSALIRSVEQLEQRKS
mgnify:CR=1 FL=1